MQARDVMTTQVMTVSSRASVRDAAQCMLEHRISGLPVVEASRQLVGIITDGDLYRRAELGTEKERRGWLDVFCLSTAVAEDYVKANGRAVGDIMTKDVVAVAPETPLREVADLLETKRIHRVPVVVDGAVVGIVSRADLVRALASSPAGPPANALNDRQVRDLVVAEYKRLPWGVRSENNVVVADGVVHLWGVLPSEAELNALRVAAEAIPGVKGFENHMVAPIGAWPIS